jgi:hypothetical protein
LQMDTPLRYTFSKFLFQARLRDKDINVVLVVNYHHVREGRFAYICRRIVSLGIC